MFLQARFPGTTICPRDQRFFEINSYNLSAMATNDFHRRAADTAADIKNQFPGWLGAFEEFRNIAAATWRHVARAPDELEQLDHVVVIFVFVSHA